MFVGAASGGLGTLASGFIVWMLKKHPSQKLFCFAVTMIMGGAIGNVIDRLLHGHVVDFIQLHYGGWYFPAFNLADSAITLGAICLILDECFAPRTLRSHESSATLTQAEPPPAIVLRLGFADPPRWIARAGATSSVARHRPVLRRCFMVWAGRC
jgi:hypothetical protein